jgi:hypothetical protein
MGALKKILYEENIDEFHHKIVAFQEEYSDQEKFMDYFDKHWCNENQFQIWSRSYHCRQFSHMLTNNFIESWHNQLKTIFMRRSRNKSLDKLVFILVNDVEYYLNQEFERVLSNNGAMSAFTKQQRVRQMEAEEIDEVDRESMITQPEIDIIDDNDENMMGVWQVRSFNDEDMAYSVEVSPENLILNCNCYDYERQQQPCKHIYLLDLHVKDLSLHFPAISAADSNAAVSTHVDGQAVPTPLAMAQHCIDINQTLRYFNNDLLNMARYMSEDDARTILESYQRTLQTVQQVKNKYETNFRRSATQLQ